MDFHLGPYMAAQMGLDTRTLEKVSLIYSIVSERKKTDGTGDKPPDKG